jgi:hypothetical protein
MSRPDDPRDDYDDFSAEQRSRSRPVAAVLVLLVAVGILTLAILGAAGALLWAWVAPVGPPAPATAPVVVASAGPDAGATRRIYERAELKAEILAANGDAVRNRLGAPNRIDIGPPEEWHYAGIARDPATGNIDHDAAVVFINGRVAEVRFTPAVRANNERGSPP